MTDRTIPFDYSLFWHSMKGLIGREPDKKIQNGLEGFYEFRFEPRDSGEVERFGNYVPTLLRWLWSFEIDRINSSCVYGLEPHTSTVNEAQNDCLRIVIHTTKAAI